MTRKQQLIKMVREQLADKVDPESEEIFKEVYEQCEGGDFEIVYAEMQRIRHWLLAPGSP